MTGKGYLTHHLVNWRQIEDFIRQDKTILKNSPVSKGLLSNRRERLRTHIVKPTDLKGYSGKRSTIEPLISHLKQDHRMNRSRYSGFQGDQINASLAVIAWNTKKWVKPPAI